jgi:hypothetical protein
VRAAGLLLLLRIGADASYVVDVLPGVLMFGLGLSATVAPLTATVLAAAPDRLAGTASGVNTAVARTAQLLSVAGLPLLAGLDGDDYRSAPAFAAGFRTAMLAAAGLLVAGGLLAALLVRDERVPAAGGESDAAPARAAPPDRSAAG